MAVYWPSSSTLHFSAPRMMLRSIKYANKTKQVWWTTHIIYNGWFFHFLPGFNGRLTHLTEHYKQPSHVGFKLKNDTLAMRFLLVLILTSLLLYNPHKDMKLILLDTVTV